MGNLVCGILSFLGASFVVATYCWFKDLRKFAFKLVFFLACSDVANSLANMIGNPDEGTGACMFQALVDSFFALSSILWTTMIAYCLYSTVIQRRPVDETRRKEKKMYLFCWGFPMVVTLLPLTTSSYGQTGGWCWIKGGEGNATGNAWRVLQLYLPLWVAMGYVAYVYYHIVKTIKSVIEAQREADAAQQGGGAGSPGGAGSGDGAAAARQQLKMIRRLQFYPVIMLVCWFFPTLNRLQNVFADKPSFTLSVLAVSFSSLQGFFNAAAYGLTPSVTTRVAQAFRECRRGRDNDLYRRDIAQVELGAMANDAVYDDEEHYDDVATI